MLNKKTKGVNLFYKKTGITLIALVVTIVVLLILSGITVNLLFSNGGIFDIANQAKPSYETGALKDRINNVLGDWYIDKGLDSTTTLDDLWDKMVVDDIIDDPEKDVEGPKKVGKNDSYDITTNEGYIVEIIVTPDGEIIIGDIVRGDELPPKITDIKTSATTQSIHVEVTMSRFEDGTLSYYYKKETESDEEYKILKENSQELTADFTGLEQNVIYDIKIIAEAKNGTTEKVVKEITGELKTGTITQKGETVWSNGTASIELETSETGVTIQYQINGMDGNWIDYEGLITGLNHEQTVYAVITDGKNQSGYTSIDILDEKNPQQAVISLSGTSTNTAENVTATVTHKDEESGVEIGNCKWIYNTTSSKIGIEASSYTNTFSSNGETITLSTSNVGTYYLHVLTVDKAGNKIETISQGITVAQLVTEITVSPTSVTLEEGETTQLTATVSPSNASNKDVTWSSNNSNIASVSTNGLITAKTVGTATITVKANDGSNKQATCSITVKTKAPTIEEKLKAGNYVTYSSPQGDLTCIVLYDSSSQYGTQIITMNTVESIEIGNGTGKDDDNISLEDFEIAKNSYNDAISKLNTRASAYLNTTYAKSARSVGSVPNNKNSQSGFYTFEFTSTYSGQLRADDNNYTTDYNQLISLGKEILNIKQYYWLASRTINYETTYWLGLRLINNIGGMDPSYLCRVTKSNGVRSYSDSAGLRPVFTLIDGIKVVGGNGTESSPYILGK